MKPKLYYSKPSHSGQLVAFFCIRNRQPSVRVLVPEVTIRVTINGELPWMRWVPTGQVPTSIITHYQ